MRHAAIVSPFIRHEFTRGVINDHHARLGPLEDAVHLFRRQAPIDGIGEDAELGASAVEFKVWEVVLGQNADPLALANIPAGQAGGHGIHAVEKVAERQSSLIVKHRDAIRAIGGIAEQHVVEGKMACIHKRLPNRAIRTYGYGRTRCRTIRIRQHVTSKK